MANRQTTKHRILDAAERLFAERGFSETSLRLITGKAEVNLASVNYHFGSKKELIQAVLARYLDRFMPAVDAAFIELDKKPDLTLQDVFEAMVQPMLDLDDLRSHGTAIFLQLLGRGYIESQGHLRWFVTTHYGDVLNRVTALVHKAAPHLPQVEVFWRLHFTLGTVVFTMSSFDALSDIARADFQQENDIESVIRRIIPYMAAGVAAPAPNLQHSLIEEVS
ncbi:transcriptional regulator, TetR family [Ferrimonas balearica DSM 9799]|uniref:Transcriptional regulator, TetR family n=1 Tax=Ferrimonas balearica (strain DSM 9799 / CCM 4581 / KCTC 23876 / PAT) TaxID=550540 RepID=E1SWD8_FERBD|nr:TetR/AcrR family transcriptional regulator [Ferrimonas balearica]ADN76420.1 transcriptional regulator, TetR family [Ferrimonas balearica DSM 9799]MBW3139321.1 TetR family transcriptional regulator [Ferrimonas balearica]MBW3163089.1 TetR family transcriptional regulator [Ferrimonas balearica]MBY5980782.1 TetR family transcriptional regulator [Ferrimonas balearica]MBY6106389.1 TetR family transcriptional regulator [Ferrimonas balearica]